MSRFFVAPEQIGTDRITMEDRNDLHHMKKVLRLQPGDEVDISDGQDWEYRARIELLETDFAELTILDKQSFAAEPSVRVTLYQGIPKQGKMETIIQKCVELGVCRIVPVFMDRTVVVDKGNFGRKIERWQKVSAEAVKQCRRGIIPEVAGAMRMSEVLAELEDYDLVLLPYENEAGTTIKDVLREFTGKDTAANVEAADVATADVVTDAGTADAEAGHHTLRVGVSKRITVLIGTEGGFSDDEVAAVTAVGGRSVTLGKTTLRTETAGMAAIAMIMYELEL
jgi:16S rRNA (uracil1498-N3)-methyltransferase